MPISFFPERDLKNIVMFLPLLDFHARPRLKMIFYWLTLVILTVAW